LARMLRGKTSDTTIQDTGPQLEVLLAQSNIFSSFQTVLPVREISYEYPYHSDTGPAGRDMARPVIFI
jgi:hypothetical protein